MSTSPITSVAAKSFLATIMTKAGLVSAEDLKSSADRADRTGKRLWETLLDDRVITEDQMAEALARYLHLPCVRLASTTIGKEVAGRIPEDVALKHTCVPVKLEGDALPGKSKGKAMLLVAMVDPTDLGALQAIEFSTGIKIRPAVSTRTEIADAIGRSYSPDQWLQRFLASIPEDVDSMRVEGLDPDAEDASGTGKTKIASTVKLVNLLLQRAIESGASDLHIEPSVNELRVRLRRDGMLTDMMQLPKWLLDSVVSRLKILAKLNIAERRRPQDGRLKVEAGGREVDQIGRASCRERV